MKKTLMDMIMSAIDKFNAEHNQEVELSECTIIGDQLIVSGEVVAWTSNN